MAEKPTVQEPIQVKEPAKPEAKAEPATIDVDKILQKLGAKTPDDLEGIGVAARQAGRLANLLGEANKRIADLENEVKSRRPASAENFQTPTGEIDLEKLIEKATTRSTEKVLYEKFLKPQQEAVAKYNADLEYVENHRLFPLIQEEWENHLKSRKVQMKLQAGQSDIIREFDQLATNTLVDTIQKLSNTVKQSKGQVGPSTPPHVEGGPSKAVPKPTTADERKEQLDTVKKNWRGEDSDVDAALAVILKDFR